MTSTSSAPAWLDEIAAAPGPPFLRMGAHALAGVGAAPGPDPGDWRLDGDDVPDLLAAKLRILGARHDEAFARLAGPDVDAASDELLAELRPGARPEPLHPLDAAGRLVAEDLCLLVLREGEWILGAGSVCFPSHWRLTEKLGRRVAEIHAPVPHYDVELADRVDRFLDRLRPNAGAWRRNWTVHSSPELFVPTPPPPPDPPITGRDAGARLWFRSEYQTLRRLPRSDAIVFGIRTQQVRLDALGDRPDVCQRLAATAESWSPEFLAYRGGEDLRRPFLAWLRSTATP